MGYRDWEAAFRASRFADPAVQGLNPFIETTPTPTKFGVLSYRVHGAAPNVVSKALDDWQPPQSEPIEPDDGPKPDPRRQEWFASRRVRFPYKWFIL